MTASWRDAPMAAFDLETTGKDPETARIVTGSVVTVGPDGVTNPRSWLAWPGIDIPEEATEIHGVTTEHAKTYGLPAARVAAEVADALTGAWRAGRPVVVMNAPYDLRVLAGELARHDLPGLKPSRVGPVLDPLVIDRACDPYRPGGRTLADLAAHYGVRAEGAHSSEQDALTAARVVWRQARTAAVRGPGRNGRSRRMDYSPLRERSLAELQAWQAGEHAAWAANFEAYLRTRADPPQPQAVVDGSWPMRAGKFQVVCVLERGSSGGKS